LAPTHRCPKNNPVRALLGAMKRNVLPVSLTVHAAQEVEGNVYVRVTRVAAAS
jgi:hypothetical protein